MAERSIYFLKGGFGCLGLFVLMGLLALLVGGSFYLDPGGAVALFCVGGIIGLVYLWAKRRGRAEALKAHHSRDTPS